MSTAWFTHSLCSIVVLRQRMRIRIMVILHVDSSKTVHQQPNTLFHFHEICLYVFLFSIMPLADRSHEDWPTKRMHWLETCRQKSPEVEKWKETKQQQKWLKPKSHHIKTESTGSNVHTFNTLCGVQYWESCNHPTFSCQFVCFRKWNWNDSMLNGSENSFMSIYLRLFLCNPLCGWCISWWHTNPNRMEWNGTERSTSRKQKLNAWQSGDIYSHRQQWGKKCTHSHPSSG